MYKDCSVQPSSVICLSICRTVCTSVSPDESEITHLYLSLPCEKDKLVTSVCHSYGKGFMLQLARTHPTVAAVPPVLSCSNDTKLCAFITQRKLVLTTSCPCSHSSTESHNKLNVIIMPSAYPCSHVCSDAKLCNHK